LPSIMMLPSTFIGGAVSPASIEVDPVLWTVGSPV
jgi:hypothetical protein